MPARGHIRRQSTARPNTVLRVLPGGPSAGLIGSTLLQGSYGEAITFTRASSATMLGADGLLATKTDNQPRIEAAGLLMENAATNLVLHNRDLTNAAWTKSNTTAAKTAAGVDGVANSCSTLTASAGNGTCLQAITTGAATRNTSVYLKRRTGTGNIDVTRDNGTTWSTVTFTGAGPNGFTRVTCNEIAALTSGAANPTVGIRIVTSGDAVDVDYFQDEATDYASSAISTGAVSVTRATEECSVSNAGMSNTAGAISADIRVPNAVVASNASRVVGFSTNVTAHYVRTATAVAVFDGTNEHIATVASVLNRQLRVRTQWSGSAMTVATADASASGSYDGDFLGAGGLLFIGSRTGSAVNRLNGHIANVVCSTSADGAPL